MLSAEWRTPEGVITVREPARAEVVASAARLAGFYNDPHNRAMLAHEDALDAAEVVEHYDHLWEDGGRPLWLELDGALIGDADLRNIEDGAAESAILIGDRAAQGRGLGTRFGLLVHALAFRALGLDRVFATIIPANQASQRLFARLGFERDDSPAARAYIDEDDDVTMSIARERFEGLHGAALADVRLSG